MKHKLLALTLIFLMIFPLMGCWDKIEVEELGYVAVIGIDKREDNFLDVTFRITNAQVGTSTKTTVDEPPHATITLAATDILSARELADTSITRRLTFTHTVAIVVSEELAKSEEFYQILEPALRDVDLREKINLIVSREKASDFIRRNSPQLETRPGKFYDFMSERWRESGIVPQSNLHRFIQRTEDNTSAYMAIYATCKDVPSNIVSDSNFDYIAGEVPKKSANPTQMIGSAIFREGKMVSSITGEETRLALLLRPKSELHRITMAFPDPMDERLKITGAISVRKKAKVKVDVSEGEPKIYVKVPVRLEILGVPSLIDYITDLKRQDILERSLEEYLQERAMSLVDKTQNQIGGEPFMWGYSARKQFWTLEEFRKYDWMKNYPKAKVYIKFDVSIKNFGRILHPPKLKQKID